MSLLLLFNRQPPFDGALMAAIARPWPDRREPAPEVVASGMAPPDLVNP